MIALDTQMQYFRTMPAITNDIISRLSSRLKRRYCDFFYSHFGSVDPSPTHFDVQFEIGTVNYVASSYIATLVASAKAIGLPTNLIIRQLEAYVANTYVGSMSPTYLNKDPELIKLIQTKKEVATPAEVNEVREMLRKATYLNKPMPFEKMVIDLSQVDRFLKSKTNNGNLNIGPFELYVRKSKRDIGTGYYRCFDIARVVAKAEAMMGKGYFTLLLNELERHLEGINTTVYVECVHNERLAGFLERRGYTSDKSPIAPCYLLEHPAAFLGRLH